MTAYILDPVCVQQTGHNLTAVKRYSELIRCFDDKVCVLVSKHLNKNLCSVNDRSVRFDLFFSHYYPDFIIVEGVNGFINSEREYHKAIYETAYRDIELFFEKYRPIKTDIIFYPSVDYYSLAALLSYMESNSVVSKIVIRFIGVMEYDHYNSGISLEKLLHKLGEIIVKKKLNLHISAESESMASYINSIVTSKITVTPTLVNGTLLPIENNKFFTIVFPGGARMDKGFGRIESILDAFEEVSGGQDYRVLVQQLIGHEINNYEKEVMKLVKNNKVIFFPLTLNELQITNLFKLADVVVAPYDKQVYKYRSSAIMAEAAIYGRPIIASADCGFSDHIQMYNLGFLAKSDYEFAEIIFYVSKMNSVCRNELCLKAHENFKDFTKNSYNEIFAKN